MKLWFLLIHAFHAEKVCPSRSRVGDYRSYVEQLITKARVGTFIKQRFQILPNPEKSPKTVGTSLKTIVNRP